MVAISQQDQIALAVYEARARLAAAEPARTYLGMSQIGEPCERKLWLQYRGAAKAALDGRVARIFDNGHATEARVIADLRLAGYDITGEQDEYADFEGRFKGHCDGIIHGITKRPHILEIKSANAEQFKAFQKVGVKHRPAYEAQMQCYMGYAGLERGLFVVENKNTQALYTERVYFDSQTFEGLKGKARRILEAPSPPIKAAEPPCDWCDFREFGCLNPPISQEPPTCLNCVYRRSAEEVAAGTILVVEHLRNLVREAFGPIGHEDARAYLLFALAARPDLTLPANLLYRQAGSVREKYTAVLDYVFRSPDWVKYANETDLLAGHFIPAPAPGPWCLHAGHRQQILNPIGCGDWVPAAPPF